MKRFLFVSLRKKKFTRSYLSFEWIRFLVLILYHPAQTEDFQKTWNPSNLRFQCYSLICYIPILWKQAKITNIPLDDQKSFRLISPKPIILTILWNYTSLTSTMLPYFRTIRHTLSTLYNWMFIRSLKKICIVQLFHLIQVKRSIAYGIKVCYIKLVESCLNNTSIYCNSGYMIIPSLFGNYFCMKSKSELSQGNVSHADILTSPESTITIYADDTVPISSYLDYHTAVSNRQIVTEAFHRCTKQWH